MKRSLRSQIIVFFILIACLMLGSCDKGPAAETTDTDPRETTSFQYFQVDTSFGTLKFPEQWKKDLKIEKNTTETGEEIIFRETITKDCLTLFTICIDMPESGSYIGNLTDAAGKTHEVYLQINELEMQEDLPKETKSRIYAMQESVNDIIDNLR